MLERMRQQNKPVTPQMEKMAAWMDGMDTEGGDGMVRARSLSCRIESFHERGAHAVPVSAATSQACGTLALQAADDRQRGHTSLSAVLVTNSSMSPTLSP